MVNLILLLTGTDKHMYIMHCGLKTLNDSEDEIVKLCVTRRLRRAIIRSCLNIML